jgi:DNA primase
MYTKSDIQLVRDTVSILDFLEKRGSSFKQAGTNYVGLCPIHNEKSGSFNVRHDNNTFHCFGCGAGGDIISLVQQMENLSFTGALQMLAEEYDIELESVESDPEYKQLQRLYRICQLASRFYREQYIALPDNHAAKMNLTDRMLKSEGDKDPTIGFAPMQGLLDVLFAEKFSKEEISQTGLIKINEEGKVVQLFRNRLIWTINDVQGRPIAFSARKIFDEDNGPKYINSPATRLYNKSKVLMGLDVARKVTNKTQNIYVVEGATDIMAFRAAGYENVIATCGTAFGPEHASVVLGIASANKDSNRFKVYFCFDGDNAGLGAAKKVFARNKNLINISNVIKFDTGDPCDIRLAGGNTALQEKIKTNGVPIVEFMLKEELATWDTKTAEGLASFVDAAKEIIKDLNSGVEIESYMRKIASWTGISVSSLATGKKVYATPVADNAKVAASLYDNLIAALLQFPEPVLALFDKYKVTSDYFKDSELAEKALAIANGKADMDSDTTKYMMMQLGTEERAVSSTETLIKNLLKALYAAEISVLNSSMIDHDDEDDAMLEEFLSQSNELKKKYFI